MNTDKKQDKTLAQIFASAVVKTKLAVVPSSSSDPAVAVVLRRAFAAHEASTFMVQGP